MKRYRVFRIGGRVACEVHDIVEASGCGIVYRLPHLMRHSPDGFECGYGGSGPADLARSIVGDLIGERDPSARLYQEVKFRLIATMPREGGEITEEEVREIVDERLLAIMKEVW